MPSPASATPTGRSHMAPRRSDQRPNSGWIREDEACDARITAPTAVYESEKRSFRKGSSAGSAPFAKSVARCPLESSAIPRRSISARTRAGWPGGSGSLRVRGGQVALDQRVRQLPLGAGELDAVAFEAPCLGTSVAKTLSLGRETGDLLQQDLDARERVAAPEARGSCGPQNRAHIRRHHRHATVKVE